jgi:hypothetical protein
MRVKVTGTEQLSKIADVLAAQGNSKALKRRMAKSFKKAADPITRDQRQNLAEKLPHRGGAAATISGEARTTVRTSWATPAVTISDSWPGHDMKAIESGALRHPTFGRGEWHTTSVEPGLLSGPFNDHKPTVVAELAKEMDVLAEEIARST